MWYRLTGTQSRGGFPMTARAEATHQHLDRVNPLRQLRVERGLSGAELARRAGFTSKMSISHIERQSPRLWSRLARLADVLGCTTDEILGRVPPAPAPVDALAREDRELLDAMREDAQQLVGPQVMRLAGLTWRSIARSMWLGGLMGQRYALIAPPPTSHVKAPDGWYTGWQSPRQRQRALPAAR